MKKQLTVTKQELIRAVGQKDPIWFLTNFFNESENTFFWENFNKDVYKEHEWRGTANPFSEVTKAIANNEWVAVESATGTGKTYLIALIAYWFVYCFPNSRVILMASTQSQLQNTLWKEIEKHFPKYQRLNPNAQKLSLEMRANPNFKHWGIKGYVVGGASKSSLANTKVQGLHTEHELFIVDEAAAQSHDTINGLINTATGEHSIIACLGNPDSVTDALHTFALMPSVRHIRVSGYDHPNYVLAETVIKGGAVTRKSILLREEKFGKNSPICLSRNDGLVSEGGQGLRVFAGEWLDNAFSKDVPLDAWRYDCYGVDPARSSDGDLASVAVMNANNLVWLDEFNCESPSHLGYTLMYADDYLQEKGYSIYYGQHTAQRVPQFPKGIFASCIGVDGVGIGASLVDTCYDQNWRVVNLQGGMRVDFSDKDFEGKPLSGRFVSLREQMYWKLSDDLREGKIKISIPEQVFIKLKRQLLAHGLVGGLRIENKDMVKSKLGGESPNLADAFVYANWVGHGYYLNITQSEVSPFLLR
jgi:hypothetical protein